MTALKTQQTIQATTAMSMQLHMWEIEDRSMRNNLPEATGTEDLAATTLAIFRQLAGESFPDSMEFDSIHRALGPHSPDPERPGM